MGPFLADRVPTRTAFWLFGVAVTASAVSLATLEPSEPELALVEKLGSRPWKHRGCKAPRPQVDSRPRLMIGPMLEAGTYRDVMREAVNASLAKSNTWRLELVDAPPATGYFIDGAVDEFEVERTGDKSVVRCELKLWVRAGDNTVAFASGNARVETTNSQRDIALSRQACITTVAEDVVEHKILSAITATTRTSH